MAANPQSGSPATLDQPDELLSFLAERRDSGDDKTRAIINALKAIHGKTISDASAKAVSQAANSVYADPTEPQDNEDSEIESCEDSSGIIIHDAAVFLAESPRPLEVLVHGILCRRHVMLIAANAGIGKSYLLADLALAVATGGTWLGHRCERGRVIIVNPEQRDDDVDDQVRIVAKHRGFDVSELPRMQLRTATTRGMLLDFEKLTETLRNYDVDLICLDSINALLDGDENNAGDVRRLYVAVDRLAEATGAAVVMMHHVTSKTAPGKLRRGSRARGSSVFLDAADCYAEIVPLYVPEGSGAAELLARYHQFDHTEPIWATAHRLEFCKVRRFAKPRDVDLIWRWPTFICDPTATALEGGELSLLAIEGGKRAAGKRGGDAKAANDAELWRSQDEALGRIVSDLCDAGTVPTIKAALDPFNEARASLGMDPVSLDTFRRYTTANGKLSWRRETTAPHALYLPEEDGDQ